MQRWIDLIAALLRHHYAVDFASIAEEVPAYRQAKSAATIKRMFERDKDELRALGIPIESVPNDEGVHDQYRLRARDFYLPYLTLIDEQGQRTTPRRPRGYGYQALTALELDATHLDLIVRAGRRVQQLGDVTLARDGAAALRKLAHDVRTQEPGTERILAAAHPADILDTLDDAIRRRKFVSFLYHGFGRNAHTTRTVRPYGLVFLSGVWYLVAHDADAAHDTPAKQFRVQRMRDVTLSGSKPQQPDFEVPVQVDLRRYAAVRQPWELGTDEPIEAMVAFHAPRGATHDAIVLGAVHDDDPQDDAVIRRRFTVRRVDAFARFLLAQGGDARPLGPPAVVAAFEDLVQRTVAAYDAEPVP